MFESRICTGATGSFLDFGQGNEQVIAWSYNMQGHAEKCIEGYCDWANQSIDQLCRVCTLCIDDHLFKHEEQETVGDLSKVCSQIVLKCMHLARMGRPDILVSKLARAVTKWTRARDRRLARLISYIHHTHDYRKYCHVGNTAQHCVMEFIPRLRFCQIPLKTRHRHRQHSMYLWKSNVRTSSTVSEAISLDAGLRMDGIPAFVLCHRTNCCCETAAMYKRTNWCVVSAKSAS